jgi:hypothetical protein
MSVTARLVAAIAAPLGPDGADAPSVDCWPERRLLTQRDATGDDSHRGYIVPQIAAVDEEAFVLQRGGRDVRATEWDVFTTAYGRLPTSRQTAIAARQEAARQPDPQDSQESRATPGSDLAPYEASELSVSTRLHGECPTSRMATPSIRPESDLRGF